MRIFLERAMGPKDLEDVPCGLCEAEFRLRSVTVRITHGDEICDHCARALLLDRRAQGRVEADWPTWERCQEALREHPKPMMSEQELERAEELGLDEVVFRLAHSV
jgi:hypothetical protein